MGDGPVIDPRDPLGLGDLPLDGPDLGTADQEVPAVGATVQDPTREQPVIGLPVVDPPDDREPDDRESEDGATDDGATDDSGSDDSGSDDSGSDDSAPDDSAPDDSAPDDSGPENRETDIGASGGRPVSPASVEPPAATLREDRDVPAPATERADDAVAPSPARGPVRPPRSGWARLGHAMRPRTTQGQLITAGLCALLGFALVVQVRQATDTQLGALRQNDLVRLLDETTTRTDELEQESLDLQRERDELLSGSDRQQAALDAARRTAAMQGILTGRLPATGPGVRITLTEPDGEIRPATMLHVLEELRNAGAEAMELNGHRITASSAFTGTRGAIELDGVTITSPFRWSVIGDPDTIAPALEIPGGALARVRADLGRGTVEKSDRVDVTATRLPSDPVHASPVADED